MILLNFLEVMHYRKLVLIIVVFSLTACGFQLRGFHAINSRYKNIHVEGAGAPQATAEVTKLLTEGGAKIAPNAKAADAVLTLSNEVYNRRVLSVDSQTGKAREYELLYHVSVGARLPDGKPLLEPTALDLQRDYNFNNAAILGELNEETILRGQMTRDAAEQIVRRLDLAQVK
jgi:LPS-assembly lipoprotein